jgi:hypothetical protein
MNSSDNPDSDEHVWESGWDEHDRLQLLRMAKLPFAQKLEWLEQAHRLVRHLEAARKKRQSPDTNAASDPPKQK